MLIVSETGPRLPLGSGRIYITLHIQEFFLPVFIREEFGFKRTGHARNASTPALKGISSGLGRKRLLTNPLLIRITVL